MSNLHFFMKLIFVFVWNLELQAQLFIFQKFFYQTLIMTQLLIVAEKSDLHPSTHFSQNFYFQKMTKLYKIPSIEWSWNWQNFFEIIVFDRRILVPPTKTKQILLDNHTIAVVATMKATSPTWTRTTGVEFNISFWQVRLVSDFGESSDLKQFYKWILSLCRLKVK